MEQNVNITDLFRSINDSLDDIKSKPVEVPDRLPSTFEILVQGVPNEDSVKKLFSPSMDALIYNLFSMIENNQFDEILANSEKVNNMMDSLFGKGAFRGKISQDVLSNIQQSVQSERYQEMKSCLGKTMKTIKRVMLVLKNLERGKKKYDKNSEEYKKYTDAVYAIKQVLKFAARVYKNRKIINKRVYNGLNNIVHEDFEIYEVVE